MYIQAFPVATTNVFPMANSTAGGQLATEFNLRSRESVNTSSSVTYMIGPTYVHSSSDFVVARKDDSNTILTISPGRALINGHYVESLASVEVDLPAAIAASGTRMSGELTIGIRMMYADTILSGAAVPLSEYAGSLEPEDSTTQMYKGIQVVILPSAQFKLPIDSPDDESAVTAHLKLATFSYVNGAVSGNIIQTPFSENGTVMSADRISGLSGALSGQYITHEGLLPNRIYTYAGKPIIDDQGNVVTSGESTWCDSTDSIMVWDKYVQSDPAATVDASKYGQLNTARFIWNDESNELDLVIPHKQIDGGQLEASDPSTKYKFYPCVLSLPTANFEDTSSYGLVDPRYSSAILEKFNEMDERYLYHPNSVQRAYVSQITDVTELPTIPYTMGTSEAHAWRAFDYVYVGQDLTQTYSGVDGRAPSTMYLILDKPLDFVLSNTSGTGDLLATVSKEFSSDADRQSYISSYSSWSTDAFDAIKSWSNASTGAYVWFRLSCSSGDPAVIYKYAVVGNVNQIYSEAIWITSSISYATESTVGGFLNVSESDLGQGYVCRDANGHLRVLDYEKLASGALAYQLGHDLTYTNLSFDALQTEINEYINDRVAFPDATQMLSAAQASIGNEVIDPSVINLTIELPNDSSLEEGETQTLYIYDIDSRFSSSVYLHITGYATAKTIVYIRNCQRLRIDNNIAGRPTIVLSNCELYYDSAVLDYVSSIDGLSLWYAADVSHSDPQIFVDGMTVRQKNVALSGTEIDEFNDANTNDSHFTIGLNALTFDTYGDVVGCEFAVQNGSTANNQSETSVFASTIDMPQSSILSYPAKHMTKPISVDGTFSVCYPTDTSTTATHILQKTALTITTAPYDSIAQKVRCTVFICNSSSEVTPLISTDDSRISPEGQVINGVTADSIHIFSGKVTS